MNSVESVWEEEVTVLQAIYADQFRLVNDRAFEIVLTEQNLVASFTLQPDYPSSIPTLSIQSHSNRLNTFGLTKFLLREAEAMTGEPMIFNIMTLIIDHLDEYSIQLVDKDEADNTTTTSEDTIKYTPIEIRVIEGGTLVNKETFEQWRLKFITECDPEAFGGSQIHGKLTGRQLFEQTLVKVDEDGDDDDKVFDFSQMVGDKSLFLDLNDLDSCEE